MPKPGMWGDRTGVTPPQCLPLQRCPCQLRARGGRSALGTHPRHPLRPRHPSLPCQASICAVPGTAPSGTMSAASSFPAPGGGHTQLPVQNQGCSPPWVRAGGAGPRSCPSAGCGVPAVCLGTPTAAPQMPGKGPRRFLWPLPGSSAGSANSTSGTGQLEWPQPCPASRDPINTPGPGWQRHRSARRDGGQLQRGADGGGTSGKEHPAPTLAPLPPPGSGG